MNNLPCFTRTDEQTGNKLLSLVDCGATNNYISSKFTKNGKLFKLKRSFVVKTIHGRSEITHYVKINLFSHDLIFFIMESLGNFDLILGMDGLRKISAKIDFMSFKLTYRTKIFDHSIHYSIQSNVKEEIKDTIERLIEKNIDTPCLPFNTNVKAEIRTTSDTPIWTKQFPYPMSCNDFVNNEIEKLLKNDIIRISHSPYNSPIWVVPKKGFNEDGTPKKRLVIDYQKLNSITIFDRYPMADVNVILSNLGKSKFFSKIDLESGFHQIQIRECDKEKTAFSVNGAKYEFNRLPFGLKNSPSIFQRAIDDILRPFIGKFAYVYMDDVIIFSNSEEEHLEHITKVINAFSAANMKISSEKSFFFETKIEFLGHIVSHGRVSIDPKKIEAIKNYQLPKTLKQLRSFLGLAGQCRKFIRNFAGIVKPLTVLLGNHFGRVGAKVSDKVQIELDSNALNAFDLIKSKIQERVELFQPDFSKPFELTTDAATYAISGFLSQHSNPIIFISRTLNEAEQKLATNEKELLAIVWALQSLRNYLYGIADFTIFTDHQPLTSAVTDKNPNLKIKRWKALVEESGGKIRYKPGKENIIADALSRQYFHLTENDDSDSSLSDSIHSSPNSPEVDLIQRSSVPLNFFKNQFHIEKSIENSLKTETIFPGYVLHTIKFSDDENLIRNLELAINKKTINAIHSTEEIFYHINRLLISNFPESKFIFTPNINRNITDTNEQEFLIISEHQRAHRNHRENFLQLKQNYFFPRMKQRVKSHVINCEICKKQKFDTQPKKQLMKATPLPTFVGEFIQIDIFHAGKRIYYSTIDRFSKFVFFRHTENKLNSHEIVEEILQLFPSCKYCMTDNDSIFSSFPLKSLFKRKNITQIFTPIRHSISNSQVERCHRTLIEMARCLAEEKSLSFEEVILETIHEYNNSIHSVIQAKPIDVFYHSQNFPKTFDLIKKAQDSMLRVQNKGRVFKSFLPGDVIFVKNDRRDKRQQAFTRHVVKEDTGVIIITDKDKKIHKDNIRI